MGNVVGMYWTTGVVRPKDNKKVVAVAPKVDVHLHFYVAQWMPHTYSN